jgi:hypothetical protein
MMMNPVLDIDRAFSLAIQQESELANSVLDDTPDSDVFESASALQVHTGDSNGKYYQNGKVKGQGHSSKGNRFCSHYHRTNHIVENCFVKRFPPGYKPKGKNQSSNQANSTSTEVLASSSYTAPTGRMQEQYNTLLELLQQSKIHQFRDFITLCLEFLFLK